jgi:hypothetical protein
MSDSANFKKPASDQRFGAQNFSWVQKDTQRPHPLRSSLQTPVSMLDLDNQLSETRNIYDYQKNSATSSPRVFEPAYSNRASIQSPGMTWGRATFDEQPKGPQIRSIRTSFDLKFSNIAQQPTISSTLLLMKAQRLQVITLQLKFHEASIKLDQQLSLIVDGRESSLKKSRLTKNLI